MILFGFVSGSSSKKNGFEILSKACMPLFQNREEGDTNNSRKWEYQKLEETLQQLSKSQKTLKQMDGASHELYQRTHSSSQKMNKKDDSSTSAIRSAFRTGCAADGLLAAELCDFLLTVRTH